MQIPKPTEQDKDFLRSIVPEDPRVEVKPMFGNLGPSLMATCSRACTAGQSVSDSSMTPAGKSWPPFKELDRSVRPSGQ